MRDVTDDVLRAAEQYDDALHVAACRYRNAVAALLDELAPSGHFLATRGLGGLRRGREYAIGDVWVEDDGVVIAEVHEAAGSLALGVPFPVGVPDVLAALGALPGHVGDEDDEDKWA
jgi:hypothetical protein